MPRIFDNLTPRTQLLPALKETLALSSRADFGVGYTNLRGWGGVGPLIDRWTPEDGPCRILVGMQKVPEDELREHFASRGQERFGIDNRTASRMRRKLAKQLRDQFTYGAPTNEDEAALRRLPRPLRAGTMKVTLFLHRPVHCTESPNRTVATSQGVRREVSSPRAGSAGTATTRRPQPQGQPADPAQASRPAIQVEPT